MGIFQIKEFVIAKAIGIAFKFGLKGDLAEKSAESLYTNWNDLIGKKRSKKVYEALEYFIIAFAGRFVARLRKLRGYYGKT